jgi:hypothetical protein
LSKEEFANYFAKIQQVKFVANDTTQPASKSSCCGGDADKAKATGVKNVDAKSGEKSCCSEGKKPETIDAKNDSNETKKTDDTTKQNEVKSDVELKPVAVVDVNNAGDVKTLDAGNNNNNNASNKQ